MQNLRDKLMKAGVVSEADAARAQEKAKEKARPAPPRRAPSAAPAPLPKLAPLPGTAAHSRHLAAEQLKLDRHLRDLVVSAEVEQEAGDTVFFFTTRKNKLGRLTISEGQAARIRAGELAIVERPDPDRIAHALVPADAAQSVLKLSQRAVRFLSAGGQQVGFLTDEEIHARATEDQAGAAAAGADAGAPESAGAADNTAPSPTADDAAGDPGPTSAASAEAPTSSGTTAGTPTDTPEQPKFITARRAPRTDS